MRKINCSNSFISILTCVLLAIVGVFSSHAVQAQEEAATAKQCTAKRPRVVLVLSGGGARGAAHVGALRALEQLQIPVDLVVGTSMGAVVGGLHASGLNANELEQVVRDIDWRDAFIDAPPRKDLTYRRKRDDDDFLINFDLGVRDGKVRLPKGLIQAQKLSLYLREFSLPVANIENFDDLPTPFRAVAADLVNGETVVLGKGDLAQAMRASMSAPGVFSPAIIDGRMLVDGGIAMNLPIQVAIDMDADIIIAIDVGFPLLPPERIKSAVDVSNQMLTILMERANRVQRARLVDTDILIQPPLGQLSSTDFAAAIDTINVGYDATIAARARLEHLSVCATDFTAWQAARKSRQQNILVPQRINITSNANLSTRVIATQISTEVGQPLSAARLREDMAQIYGLGLFEQVDYSVSKKDDVPTLSIDARARSWGPGYLRFGLALEEDFEGSGSFAVSGRYLRTAVNRLGAEWRSNLTLGTNLSAQTEFYQPLSFDLRYFVAPVASFEQRNIAVFQNDDRVARFRLTTAIAGFDFGRELSNWGELRLGVERGQGNARLKVGDPLLDNLDFNVGAYKFSFGFDTLDDTVFPASGSRFELNWRKVRRELGSTTNYETFRSSFAGYRTFGRHTWSVGVDLATNNGANDVVQEFYALGGFLNMSGFDRGELIAPHAALARLVYQRRTGRTGGGLFEWPLYFGGSVELGNVWQQRSDARFDDLIVNASLFLRFDTFFGPLYFATGFAETGETSLYLFLGATGRR